MADRIELKGVQGFGYHGVLEHEREHGQNFSADVTCWVDLAEASRTDQLEHTINYAELAQIAHDALTGEPKQLIEAVAGGIADTVLERYPQIHAVEVTVHKPHAPIPVPFADVAIVARRSRGKGPTMVKGN